jgi:hypothetical protein
MAERIPANKQARILLATSGLDKYACSPLTMILGWSVLMVL